VKYTCPCRRLKKEFPCDVLRRGLAKVDCDDFCKQKKEEEIKVLITVFKRLIQVKLGVTGKVRYLHQAREALGRTSCRIVPSLILLVF